MFGELLYNLIIGPLETLFGIIYAWAYELTENPGAAIICLSLLMNLLLLPLYNQTDAIQAQANETEKRLSPGVKHIKKTFHGNEQYMMLQTFYRINGYKPTDALKGVAPLALEIPFFMAAYHYLSHLALLEQSAFGPIQSLSEPDGLLVIGELSINLLPIAMTVINILSSLIYTRGATLKTKIQLYGMAAIFLVLLYDSPAALSFYWMLNNLFSLIKNIIISRPSPIKTVARLCFYISMLLLAGLLVGIPFLSGQWIVVLLVSVVLLNIPAGLLLHRLGKKPETAEKIYTPSRSSFLIAELILTVLVGFLIPSAMLYSSPEEFIPMAGDRSVLRYVLYCGAVSSGTFLLWMGLLYCLARPRWKKLLENGTWILCGIFVTDYMFFGTHYGTMTNQLLYETELQVSMDSLLINLAVLAGVCLGIGILLKKKPSVLKTIGMATAAAMVAISAFNMITTYQITGETRRQMEENTRPESLFQLSKTGKNVVILMMDRAVGGFIPYIFNEKPELQQQYDGFTYYPNTLSYGAHTNVGLPAVFGGYEYTPHEMNLRDQQLLVDKHTEALLMMPRMFTAEGFQATVCDPTYAGYGWYPDLSIFEPYPEIPAYITRNAYTDRMNTVSTQDRESLNRKFLSYSFFRCAPVAMHSYLYDGGSYRELPTMIHMAAPSVVESAAPGTEDFAASFSVLQNLKYLTEITEEPGDHFLMMCNDTTHSPQLLQMPEYEPAETVDNRLYEKLIPEREDAQGNTIQLTARYQMYHYHVNMAAYRELAKWFQYLKDNDVYDNTRIIMASDHGYSVRVRKELLFGDAFEDDILFYNPILLVKDFDATGPIRMDPAQMTSADVPTLATGGLIENPRNPFTGNPITSDGWKDGPIYISLTHVYSTAKNNGTTFLPDPWAAIEGDMWDQNNWHIIEESQIPIQ